ncbi:MAG: GNAT family N-acetyltransferase [Anaerolineae bacterium]|nr:GNAT family N-acetyltransferase [Anaerolineae bacterium]
MCHTLTLAEIALEPHTLWYDVRNRTPLRDATLVRYRPLVAEDVDDLTAFLESLSPATRAWWYRDSYDRAGAEALCAAIGRYDKLRMVAVDLQRPAEGLLALFEFSFGIPPGDHFRYGLYGVTLDETRDCRFGPCVRDDWQGRGLGSALMPATFDIARHFGRQRVFLWGGVYAENHAAIAFYRKHGFAEVGRFCTEDDRVSLDMIRDLVDTSSARMV